MNKCALKRMASVTWGCFLAFMEGLFALTIAITFIVGIGWLHGNNLAYLFWGPFIIGIGSFGLVAWYKQTCEDCEFDRRHNE